MKILIFSDPANPHTIKWVNSLIDNSVDVYLFGLRKFDISNYPKLSANKFLIFPISEEIFQKEDGNFNKLIYLKALLSLKKFIRKVNPDILHSHYATSYGLIGILTSFHPHIISAWGSDIYTFPKRSFIHKIILKYILKKPEAVFSTSNVMADEIKKYFNGKIFITPFGIDTNKFIKLNKNSEESIITIGTVKTLEYNYGIQDLLQVFSQLYSENENLRLLIVGGGSKLNEFKKIAEDKNIGNVVEFTGFVNYDNIVEYHNRIDIFAAFSKEESFGVSILEAMSCEKPVVVSDAPGFKEIVRNNETGFIINRDSISDSIPVFKKLIDDKSYRENIGAKGREFVKNNFNLQSNIKNMISIYSNILKDKK